MTVVKGLRRYGIYLADQDRMRTRSHGIINYSIGLVASVSPLLASDEVLIVYTNEAISSEIDWVSFPNLEERRLPSPKGPLSRILLDEVRVLQAARADHLHVLHFPKGMIPLRKPGATALIASIHDDIPFQYLRGFFGKRSPLFKNVYISLRLFYALHRAGTVVTLSEFSANALARLKRQVIVAGIGVERAPVPDLAWGERDEIVVLCSDQPHKLTSALLALIDNSPAIRAHSGQVTLIGSLPKGLLLDADRYAYSTYLSTENLEKKIRNARLLICGSSYEGFGLPPVEAWAWGTPALYPAIEPILSNLNGIPGGYDMKSATSFETALTQLLSIDDSRVQRHSEQVAERFAWNKTAQTILSLYRRSSEDHFVR